MLSTLLLVSLHLLQVLAILPIEQEFITNGEKVSSIQQPPPEFKNSQYYKKDQSVFTYSNSSSSGSNSTSGETVLNLVPGITTLKTDTNNECYFVEAIIGKNNYPLIIDTGSAYLWVYGDNCTDTACHNRSLYTPSEQDQLPTETFALAYVTGTASGDVYQDNIIVNKLATTEKFKFGVAESVPDFFANYPISGILGLPSNNSNSIQSIISVLFDSHAISTEKFSLSLGNDTSLNADEYPNSGIFTIGEPVDELYVGDLTYTNVLSNTNNYWLIELESVTINGFTVNFTDSVSIDDNNDDTVIARKAIIDSGTTVLALPKQDAIDVHSYFTNSITDGTNFAIYCNSSLIIELEINNTKWMLDSKDYLGAAYSEKSGYYGYCVSNIQGVSTNADDSWILGAVFLKTVYAVFDSTNQQLGLAEKNTDLYLTSTSTSHASSATVASSLSTSFTSSASSKTTKNSKTAANAAIVNSFSLSGFLVSLLLMV